MNQAGISEVIQRMSNLWHRNLGTVMITAPGNIDPEYVPQRSQLEDANFALHCAYEEIDSLKSALKMYEAHMSVMQKDAETYLTPNSDATVTEMFHYKDDEWFVSRMLYHLDGPMQRKVQSVGRKVLKETL